tara:strand:+ start:7673 stop:8134 length:462 start_codon:yes stop_codon:yes gene_type:complete
MGGPNASTGVCYVCFDDGAPKSQCSCRDRFIHDECLLKQVVATHKMECPVCLQPYANLESRSVWQLSRRALCFFSIVVTMPCLMTVGIWRTADWLALEPRYASNSYAGRAAESVAELVVAIMMGLYAFGECFLYRRGQWRFLKTKAVVQASPV